MSRKRSFAMRMWNFLAILLVLVLNFQTHADAARPNILFPIADDLGWADVPWHGSEIELPYLDRLARSGVILD